MISRLDVVVLIAALGAGAVVAVPRHLAAASDARGDEVAALARAAATAARLGHARWLAANQPPVIDGVRGAVAITNGYPSVATLPLMLTAAETATFSYDDGYWGHASLNPGRTCGVSYQPPAAPGQNPAISSRTSGC